MEGKEIGNDLLSDEEFNFFTDFNLENDGELFKIFPFESKEEKYYDVIFPKMAIETAEPKKEEIIALPQESILAKISSFESNYQLFVNNETAANKKPNSSFEENLKQVESTLPGYLISLMRAYGKPIDFQELLESIQLKFKDFRKSNGAKYSEDSRKVLKSTLKTSGMFFHTEDNKYYYKEQESMNFIIKTLERELKKKMSKDKSEIKSKSKTNMSSSSKSKKKTNELSFSAQMNYKICKINSILDQMLTKCRGEFQINTLNSSSIEMIKKISEKDKFVGILMCIKYFKNLIEKFVKYIHKKKNIEKLFDLKKINERIKLVCDKIEKLESNINLLAVEDVVMSNEQETPYFDMLNNINH